MPYTYEVIKAIVPGVMLAASMGVHALITVVLCKNLKEDERPLVVILSFALGAIAYGMIGAYVFPKSVAAAIDPVGYMETVCGNER